MSFRGTNQVLNLYKKRGKIPEMTNPTPLGWGTGASRQLALAAHLIR